MTKIEAILVLINEAQTVRQSAAAYRRCLKAIGALELTTEESCRVLYHLEYTHEDGTNYQWLNRMLNSRRPKQATKETQT